MDLLSSSEALNSDWTWSIGDGYRRDWPDELAWCAMKEDYSQIPPEDRERYHQDGALIPAKQRKTVFGLTPWESKGTELPLRDFYVSMPNLVERAPDLHNLPQQVKTALSFLRAVCPREIVTDDTATKLQILLPPQLPQHTGKRTLVLDLDETLVHCHPSPVAGAPPPGLHMRIETSNIVLDAHVYVRPFTQLALEIWAQIFEVVVFTASVSIYADRVLDFLDPEKRLITHRLYRQHCTEIYGGHFKDLRRMGRRLEDCVLVDNSPLALGLIPDNGIPVSSWFGDDYEDSEILDLIRLLEQMADSQLDNLADFLVKRYSFERFLNYLRTTERVPGLPDLPSMSTGQSSSGLTTQVER